VAQQNAAAPGAAVRVAFVTGETFPRGDQATDPGRVAEWVVAWAGGKRAVTEYVVEGAELAARVELADAGGHVVAVALSPRFIELPPSEFAEYLHEERAAAALAERDRRGQEQAPGRELYTKFAKTFVGVGTPRGDTAYREPVGHVLEIVPLSDPSRWNVGDEVLVRVLLEGKPAAGLRVSSGREGLPPHEYAQHGTTGADGVAHLKLGAPGLWFVRTHVIRPIAPGGSGAAGSGRAVGTGSGGAREPVAAEWESFWASITFRLAGLEPAAP
jgi:hypothetical protein